jgi:hypothetical protein
MGSVLNPPRSSPVRNARPVALIVVGLVVVVGAFFFVAERMLSTTSFVDRVTVVNPTQYRLEIEATGAGRKQSVGLGSIGREQTKDFEHVIDQGGDWIFHFGSAWADGGEVRETRDQLRRDGWRLTVPAEVAARLQAAGMTPSLVEPG